MEKIKPVWKRIQTKIGGWDLPVLVLWAVTLFCIGPFVLLQVFSPRNRYGAIPVAIHSQSKADYSQDPRNRFVPVISLNILRDLMLGGEDLDEITWLQTLTATYRPAELTTTPQPVGTLEPAVTPTPSPTQNQPVEVTATHIQTATQDFLPTEPGRKTDIATQEPSATPRPPATSTPRPSPITPTPVDPTNTPRSSNTPVVTDEPTPVTPTDDDPPTPIVPPTKTTAAPPTNTPRPQPTNTPAPPTPVPTDPIVPTGVLTPITFPTKETSTP